MSALRPTKAEMSPGGIQEASADMGKAVNDAIKEGMAGLADLFNRNPTIKLKPSPKMTTLERHVWQAAKDPKFRDLGLASPAVRQAIRDELASMLNAAVQSAAGKMAKRKGRGTKKKAKAKVGRELCCCCGNRRCKIGGFRVVRQSRPAGGAS